MAVLVLIIKVCAAAVLFIALILGIHAHVTCAWLKSWESRAEADKHKCADEEGCPQFAVLMEQLFLVVNSFLFVISVALIVIGFFMGEPQMKKCDGGYSAIAAVLIFLSGAVMIASAITIDNYKYKGKGKEVSEEILKINREEDKYVNKLAAGALAMVDALLYVVACVFICKSN